MEKGKGRGRKKEGRIKRKEKPSKVESTKLGLKERREEGRKKRINNDAKG